MSRKSATVVNLGGRAETWQVHLRRCRRACPRARSAHIDQKRGPATESLSRALRMTPGGSDCLQLHSETNGRAYFTAEIGRRCFLVAVGNSDQTFTELWVQRESRGSDSKASETFTLPRDGSKSG